MILLQWILVAFLIRLHSNLIAACELKHSNNTLYGLQCVTSVPTEIWQTAQPQCVWRCLRAEACRYINHNSATGQCELGFSQCESLQPAAGVIVNVFGPPRHDCLRWGSDQKAGWVPIQERNGHIYVGRTTSNDLLIIGSFFVGGGELCTNREGERMCFVAENQNIEILTKDTACPLPWMPYTAGEPLPSGAVAGGHLADGSALYVMKIADNPKESLAYYEHSGARTTTSMEMLILL